MRVNEPVTQVEENFPADANILSTTTPGGRITYINEDFVRVSGFDREELLGQPHNMIRHPDMPSVVFAQFWNTLKSGRPWMGVVKNRCKNGNHYWVDAFVTPIKRDGRIIEFQSVRRKPDRDCIQRADHLYQQLRNGGRAASMRQSLPLRSQILLAMLPVLLAPALLMLLQTAALQWLVVGTAALMSITLVFWLLHPLNVLVKDARLITDDLAAQKVYTGRTDDIGRIRLALRALEAEAAGLVGRIHDSAGALQGSASTLGDAIGQSRAETERQFSEIDQVSTAVNEMSTSIQEVASNAHSTAAAAQKGHESVQSGKAAAESNMTSVQGLKDEVNRIGEIVNTLAGSSASIAHILDVIGEITEQINLLALNAAIEAARAGDAGRGFAVVADEVRSLATRTQSSTGEIRKMIEELQTGTSRAVDAMGNVRAQADGCVEQTGATTESFNSVLAAIANINAMTEQIATAVEQQSVVAEQINRSVVSIQNLSQSNMTSVERSAETSRDMVEVATRFGELSRQFWDERVSNSQGSL